MNFHFTAPIKGASKATGIILWMLPRKGGQWNSGYSYWPSDSNECVDIFSRELIIHEFGHALNYGWGQNDLQNLFESSYSGNPSTIGEIAIWLPFPTGSPDASNVRTTGRIYGNRW